MPATWIGPFDVSEVSIGRDSGSLVVVDDVSVSRRHARLLRDGASWRIVDLGSENGTWVEGRRVMHATLRPGEPFHVGQVELVIASSAESLKLPPPSRKPASSALMVMATLALGAALLLAIVAASLVAWYWWPAHRR